VKTLGTYFNFHHNFCKVGLVLDMSGLLGLNIFSQTSGIKMQKIGFRKKGNSSALGCAEMLGSCGSCCTNGKSLRAIETLTWPRLSGNKISCTNGKSLRAIETFSESVLV